MAIKRSLWAGMAVSLILLTVGGPKARADSCRVLAYEFQPLPFDRAHDFVGVSSGQQATGAFDEGGPQIALWLETVPPPGMSRGSFVADIFVTARTAVRGIGNRPGNGMFVSSPKFPYGPRENVLPVWAYARGHTYPRLLMHDGMDESFGFHEATSSGEDFFCRPLKPDEVDGISCPTPVFKSDKGKFDSSGRPMLYPPRGDVAAARCSIRTVGCTDCPDDIACTMLADLDDIAAVSGATPSPYTPNSPGLWVVPSRVPDGEYRVFLEVNKQYDQDAPRCLPAQGPAQPPVQPSSECPAVAPSCDSSSRMCVRHEATYDDRLLAYGMGGNIGQPSVVWAATVLIDGNGMHVGTADNYLGYGDWDYPRGNLFPPDPTISQRDGSGAGRIARVVDGSGAWRFRVTSRANANDLPAPPAVSDLKAEARAGDLIAASFTQVGLGGKPVAGYQIRWRNGETMSEEEFAIANPGPVVQPGIPGTKAAFELTQQQGILAERTFTIGVRAVGECNRTSLLQVVHITTPRQNYTTLSGCFLATAAYGSDLGPEVGTLRRFRDRFLIGHPVGAALVRLYYASSPPLARLLEHDGNLRAGVRAFLRPLVAAAKAALVLGD